MPVCRQAGSATVRWTKADAIGLRFCYAKSNNENGKSLDFPKTGGNGGKKARYMSWRGLSEEEIPLVEQK